MIRAYMSNLIYEDNPLRSVALDKRWLVGAVFQRRAMQYAAIEHAAAWRSDWQSLLDRLEDAWLESLAAGGPIPETTAEALMVELKQALPDLSADSPPPYGDASFFLLYLGCVMIVAVETCVDPSDQPLNELWSLAEQLPYTIRSLVDEDNLPTEQEVDRELAWIRQLPSLFTQELKPADLLNYLSARFPVWHEPL